MSRSNSKKTERGPGGVPVREVPIAWEALEDAFENNAPEVHSYLHLETGEVIRIVDGIADPEMHQRIMEDSTYMQIDPVSSREQYRWMERFITTVDDPELRHQLIAAIDGKGAFRRFKDVLMSYPVERERWFTFRSERLRACMEAWLQAHGIEAVERPEWRVPTADEVQPKVEQQPEEAKGGKRSRAQIADAQRKKLQELVEALPARELDAALAFLEFLRERKHIPRPRAKATDDGEDAGKGTGAGKGKGKGKGEAEVEAQESDEATG
ncbi:MAG: UPF0158 family protein [Polyangiales bacterium]